MSGIRRVLPILLLCLPLFAQAIPFDPFSTEALPLDPATAGAMICPALDLDALALEDQLREEEGLAPRFAVAHPVTLSPGIQGDWENYGESHQVWRVRIYSPDALSLNFGFSRYNMVSDARMLIYSADGSEKIDYAFTEIDNDEHGELWTPVILSNDVVVEVTVPVKALDECNIELTSVNRGYRGFGELLGDRSGYCNNDVVCPEGDPWRDEIASVGVISTGGTLFCTGFMVNNTSEDQTPYFMTAKHCGISGGNASSLVVYWNFQSPSCGQQGGGSLNQWQSGSWYRAGYSTSDFTLVELDDAPNPDHEVSYSGWDNSTANPSSAVAIHHPSTDEKSISFEYDACTTTSYLSNSQPGDGSHIRVIDWDDGTTEPGSSGSPLYDQNHRVVGQLHGGYAACGNDTSDWYGRFSRSWTGGGSSSSRLSNWLDAAGTGQSSVNTLVPGASGMAVSPSDAFSSSGDSGGPFSPSSKTYTVTNQGESGFSFSVTHSAAWVSLSSSGSYLSPGNSANITVSINSSANSLPSGGYEDLVYFTNTSTHEGDTSRSVNLQVGVPSLVYDWDLNSNPGWSTTGDWAWGQPTGGGGQYGNADPTSGHTGSKVYGYNLSGDYGNNLPERHLTTGAIDCSNLSAVSVKFWRWLGVEQSSYDHAYLRVSTNGSSWTTVWENSAEVADSNWSQKEYDLSAIADGEATVFLRWTMGTTDGSWQYCGWNIDDVEIWGVGADDMTSSDDSAPARTALLANFPNPFNPRTEVPFELSESGYVRLSVFDITGRQLKVLESGLLPAGRHQASWDGRAEDGETCSAGVYFIRLETEQHSESRKITLVK